MKRSMILMGAAVMISSVIFAQKKEKGHRNGEGHLEKIKSELSLSDTQYASIKGINKKYAERFFQLRKDSVTSRTEKLSEMKDLRDEKEKEINAVLTPDQKTNYERFKKERAEKRKSQLKMRAEKHQAQIIKDLSLTDDQASKFREANKKFVEKTKELRAGSASDNEARKEEFKKLRKEHETTLQSILTTEQFSKWKDIRKSMKGKHKRKGR